MLDIDFGQFFKSDLYNSLNNNFVIPTVLSSDYRLEATENFEDISCYDNVFFVYHIAHTRKGNAYHIDYIYGEIPCSDEVYIWGFELLKYFPHGFKLVSLNEAVLAISKVLSRMFEQPIMQNNRIYFSKPTNLMELFKYHRYLGIV